MGNRNILLKKMVLSAIMIAIGTVLSMFKFEGIWAFGGGVTFCAMLPLVLVAFIYGTRQGMITAFAFSLIQLLLGIDNIQYATSITMAIAIIMLDYILAYSVIGLSAIFKKCFSNESIALVVGICFTFFLRLFCHFLSGWLIWDSLWPNEFGLLSPIYSLYYNGSYMLPEAVITSAVGIIIYKTVPALFKEK